jgi:hypothetical protein
MRGSPVRFRLDPGLQMVATRIPTLIVNNSAVSSRMTRSDKTDSCVHGHRTLCWRIAVLSAALMMSAIQPCLAHAAAAYPEEAVKAVFLYRFAGYVTWPASTANAPQFTIAVLGEENVAKQLKEFLPGHSIQGKPARVASIQGLGQLGDAQMVYIGSDFAGKLGAVLEALKDRPVLIVTDQPGALEEGSTVNFLIEQQHVRFEISTVAAKRSGLAISSGLLTVAERVKTSDLRGRSLCRPFEDDPLCRLRLVSRMNRARYRGGG